MALSPLKPTSERAVITTATPQTSRTYSFDFDTGAVGGIINGEDAMRQAIRKAVATARWRFLIYNGDYGCEIDDIVTEDPSDSEIERVITEALLADDRISDVNSFEISRDGDIVYVSFYVVTVEGAFEMEVTT